MKYIIDLEKSGRYKRGEGRGFHKYIKRTGTPGNYKYWYKLPSGKISTMSDEYQKHGKVDHARRLAIKQLTNKESLGESTAAVLAEISRRTGVPIEGKGNIRNIWRNLQNREGGEGGARRYERHTYSEEDLSQKEDTEHPTENALDHTNEEHRAAIQAELESRGVTRKKTRKKVSRRTGEQENRRRQARIRRQPRETVPPRAEGAGTPETTRSRMGARIMAEDRWDLLDNMDIEQRNQIQGLGFISSANPEGIEFVGTHFAIEYYGDERWDIVKVLEGGGSVKVLSSHDSYESMIEEVRRRQARIRRQPRETVREVSLDDVSPEIREAVDFISGWGPSLSDAPGHIRDEYSQKLELVRGAGYRMVHGRLYIDSATPTSKKKTKKKARGASRPSLRDDNLENVDFNRRSNEEIEGLMSSGRAADISTEELRRYLSESGFNFGGEVSEAEESVKRIAEARKAIKSVQPDYESGADAASSMAEEQASGDNPYLNRASAIWNDVKGSYERSDSASHKKYVRVMGYAMQAIKDIQDRGLLLTTTLITREAKALAQSAEGNSTGINNSEIKKAFSQTTSFDIEEIIANKPVDAQLEAMRSGYPAKQFARLKPFLTDSWTSANPSAPPPYPTFGDIKTWTEHGGEKPEWAGNTQIAVPREVFDAAHKELNPRTGVIDKPKYPPRWMPIHMMPLWNYIAKKMAPEPGTTFSGQDPRYGIRETPQIPDIGSNRDGIIISSIRKYVLRRGGPGGLVDIPARTLEKVGTTQEEIFRSELSDQEIKKLMTTKHIPLEEIISFIDEEISSQNNVKKSFVCKKNLKKSKKHVRYTIDKSYRGSHWKNKENKENYDKNSPKIVVNNQSDKKEKPKPKRVSDSHREYLRRIGALKSFVVRKDME